MATRTVRAITWVAGFAWLVVAGCGLRSAMVDVGDGWELPYVVLTMALLVGAALSVTVAAWATRQSGRPRLRMVGLVVTALGVVASFVAAWALPLWMTVLGVGFATIAVAAPRQRREVALLAAGQLVGLAVLFAGIASEVGRRDVWGDYPAAGGIAVVVTAVITGVALYELARSLERRPVTEPRPTPALVRPRSS